MSEQHPHYTMNGRIWIDTPDGKVLGHGRVELLERIQNNIDKLIFCHIFLLSLPQQLM